MERLKEVLKGVWLFCSYLFWPQWGRNKKNAVMLEVNKRCRQVGH